MNIVLRIDPFLQEFTEGQEIVEVTGKTIGECLRILRAQFPSIDEHLGIWDGSEFKFFPDIFLGVNNESKYSEELDRSVNDGDEISIGVISYGG